MERTHGTGVAQALVGSFLPTKVGEGIEATDVIETPLILTVTALHLSIVPGRVGADELVANPQFFRSGFKEGLEITAAVGEAIGEFKAVIGLDTFNGNTLAGKMRSDLRKEISGGIRALLLVSGQNAIAGILVDGGVLIQLHLRIGDAAAGYDLHIDLDALAGILHLLVRLRLVRFLLYGFFDEALSPHHPPQAFDCSGIPSFSHSCPQLHDPEPGVSPVHVVDELAFLRGMLVRVAVGTAGLAGKGLQRPVVACKPEIDVRPGSVVLAAGAAHAVLLRVDHQGLAVLHILCYTVHEA